MSCGAINLGQTLYHLPAAGNFSWPKVEIQFSSIAQHHWEVLGSPLPPAQPPFLLPFWLHSAPCQQQHLPLCKVSQAWVTSTCRTGCHSRDFGVPNPVTPFDNLQFPYPACPAVGEFRLWQKLCLPSEGLKTPTRSADSSLSTKKEKHGHQRGFFSPPCPSPLPATDPTGLML